jgi:DNA-binding response OmpR family regulator
MLALENGADDYMVKPVPHEALAARLKRLSRQARISLDNEVNQTK